MKLWRLAGIPVLLADRATPTPAVSYAVVGKADCRGHHDNGQPQSLSLEWSEVQGALWRFGAPVDPTQN